MQFCHGQRGAFQILRIGIVSKDVSVLAVHRSVTGHQNDHGVGLRCAALEKILESQTYGGGGCFIVGEQQDIVHVEATGARALQEIGEDAGIAFGKLQRQIGFLVFRNPDQQGVGGSTGHRGRCIGGCLIGECLLQLEDFALHPNCVRPLLA